MTPETLMRRPALILELPAGSEATMHTLAMDGQSSSTRRDRGSSEGLGPRAEGLGQEGQGHGASDASFAQSSTLNPQRIPSLSPRSRLLLVAALLVASGCQSSNSFTRLFQKPNPGEKKSLLAILDKDKPGLPQPTKGKPKEESLSRQLDRAEKSLTQYYSDGNPAHLKDAHHQYELALVDQPGNAECHHGLAIVCDLQENFSAAELHYRAALEDDPKNGKILGDLGYSYLLQNRLSDSEDTLVLATKVDPQNTQAFKNLATVYAKQGNYNLAESTIRRVMNEGEVRQEMAQLFPTGRPDLAREGERSKLPWQRKDGITTEEFKNRLDSAKEQDLANMRKKKSALDVASPEVLTIEQQKFRIAQLEQERDEALRLVEFRREQQSNRPIMVGALGPDSQMQINPQYVNNDPQRLPNGQGRRVANGFYPDGPRQNRNQNSPEIQQAHGQDPHLGPNGQPPVEQALHRTNQGIDPRTGMPINSSIQQTNGQQPLTFPNGGEGADQQGRSLTPPALNGGAAAFEEAKRRAAITGMGGSDLMFNVPTVESGNRMTPGTGSTWNGGQYPEPQRNLPTDAAPHDLNSLMKAPSGEMTVQPNQMGMLNSPSGRSFSNPNFDQRLSPQIPIESPMGKQGMNYQEQANWAQQQQQQQQPQYRTEGSPDNSQTSGYSNPNSDPRNRMNAELNQHSQTLQHNAADYNQGAWNQTSNPAQGVPNQPRVDNPSKLLTPSWNQQQFTPQITPAQYPSRIIQGGYDQSSSQNGYGTSPGDRNNGSSPMGTASSEPAPIYSSGVSMPPSYNSRGQSRETAGQSYGQSGYTGPRITPARR